MTDDANPAPFFTVFTPTYNAGHLLHRVYTSLRRQTFRDFEWVVVDDGSTDDTRQIVQSWQREAEFPIRYFFQDNRGKHFAHNRGVREARGLYFLNADADDTFVPEALETFRRRLAEIPDEEKDRYYGVELLCRDQRGEPVGGEFPRNGMSYDFVEMFFQYKFRTERWRCGRTDVEREVPFPEVAAGSWLPETPGKWLPIGRRYKVLGYNDRVRIWHREERESLSTTPGYRFAAGRRESAKIMLNRFLQNFRHDPRYFVAAAAVYSCHSFHLGISLKQQALELTRPAARLLWLVSLPLGWFVFRMQDRRRRKEEAQ